MAKPLSSDLRLRIIRAVKDEGMSCRGAASRFGVAPSTAIELSLEPAISRQGLAPVAVATIEFEYRISYPYVTNSRHCINGLQSVLRWCCGHCSRWYSRRLKRDKLLRHIRCT